MGPMALTYAPPEGNAYTMPALPSTVRLAGHRWCHGWLEGGGEQVAGPQGRDSHIARLESSLTELAPFPGRYAHGCGRQGEQLSPDPGDLRITGIG